MENIEKPPNGSNVQDKDKIRDEIDKLRGELVSREAQIDLLRKSIAGNVEESMPVEGYESVDKESVDSQTREKLEEFAEKSEKLKTLRERDRQSYVELNEEINALRRKIGELESKLGE